MKILVIDNYDSFTYNLVHIVKKNSGVPVDVARNDEITLDQVSDYDKIILSPGPGLPDEAGLLTTIIREYAPYKTILGVCLGHQAICEVFGGKLINLKKVYHGIATPVRTTGKLSVLFKEMPESFEAGRYHSWIVDNEKLPDCLDITSVDEEGIIMSVKHKEYKIEGVQFHPESVLTPLGVKMIDNWIKSL